MGWRIELSDLAEKQLASLGHIQAQRIVSFLHNRLAVLDHPRLIGEPLKGPDLSRFWKYRVGDYRLVASIEDDEVRVLVVRIGHRREVYR